VGPDPRGRFLGRRGVAKQRKRGPVLFCGQKPYLTWPRDLPPEDPEPHARAPEPAGGGRKSNLAAPPPSDGHPITTEPTGGKSNARAREARLSLVLPIAGGGLGLAALALIGFLVAPLLAPAPQPAPKTLAALPALVAPPPPLMDSPSQTMESNPLASLEPPPIQIGVPEHEGLAAAPSSPAASLAPSPSSHETTPPAAAAPLPPVRPPELAPPFKSGPAVPYDQSTAVYDISAHTVYLPDGTRLEAHSGLGDRLDNPRFVDERDRGATPPGVYQLTLRESLFHGVQALRLNPIGAGFTFNRVGLLAHPYMLGPNGDSNGCVSFKNYDAFLRAFQSGEVRRLAVVAQWAGRTRQLGLFASLR
jgi:Tlde1 domain